MGLLKTTMSEDSIELVIGTAEDEDSYTVGVIDGVDAAKPHIYIKVPMKAEAGDRVGDAQLNALRSARDLIGAEISKLTALQQAR